MIWQRLAAVVVLRLCINSLLRRGRLFCLILSALNNLGVLEQIEIELIQTLRLGAEPMPINPVQLVLKLFDLEAQSLDLVGQKAVHRPQLGEVTRMLLGTGITVSALPQAPEPPTAPSNLPAISAVRPTA